jgi:peptidoglycan/xylan/chitin deacetylase (PgdA/CDA1 family)
VDFIKPPKFARSLFSDLVFCVPNSNREVYLTFDDGPNPETTPKILELLDSYNAKATFFCLGKNVEAYPDLYQSIIEKGHAIGNHSFSHLNGWKTKTADYLYDVEKASHIIASALFRPPYGKVRPKQVKALKDAYKLVLWSLNTQDYKQNLDVKLIIDVLKNKTETGSIVLFHDSDKSFKNTNKILPAFLSHLSKSAYNIMPMLFST